MVSRLSKVSVLIAALVTVGGCIRPAMQDIRPAPVTAMQREAGFSPEEQAWLDDNCPAGLPTKDPEWPHGPTAYVVREGYALELSCADRVPLWVCEHVTPEELAGDVPRKNRFKPDPELEASCRAELADYKRSGFDRGHQAPAGNQTVSQALKDETFFLSNMAPQVGRGFNQLAWRELEDLSRTWVEEGLAPTAHMITGGFFWDPAEEDPTMADGLIPHERIGDNGVAVPTHFYKIVASQQADESWRAVAFVMENRAYRKPYDFAEFIRSIEWVEARTGLDFLPDLGPVEGPELESEPGELFE